jgi:hypothetical protein
LHWAWLGWAGGANDGWERAAWDGRARQAGESGAGWARGSREAEWAHGVQTGRPRLEKAVALEKASSGRAVWWMRLRWLRATAGKGNIAVFFFEKSHNTEGGAEEACWVGLGTSRPDGTGSDGRSDATIIVFYFHNI